MKNSINLSKPWKRSFIYTFLNMCVFQCLNLYLNLNHCKQNTYIHNTIQFLASKLRFIDDFVKLFNLFDLFLDSSSVYWLRYLDNHTLIILYNIFKNWTLPTHTRNDCFRIGLYHIRNIYGCIYVNGCKLCNETVKRVVVIDLSKSRMGYWIVTSLNECCEKCFVVSNSFVKWCWI